MKLRSPTVVWDETAAELRAVLWEPSARDPAETVRFRTVCWVEFAESGRVCAAHVHDLPPAVESWIPAVHGSDVVGHALLDTGWLWIPLTAEPQHRRRTGVADVELDLNGDGVASLVLRFAETDETSSTGS